MPGPPPKQPGRRQRRNTASMGVVVPGPGTAPEVPEAAKEWLTTTKTQWVELWKSSIIKAYAPTDLPAMYRLFTLRDDRERYHRTVRKFPTVMGSMGQERLNPLMQTISTLDSEIRQLEDRFGLSPSARLRLGITLGEAARSLDDLMRGAVDDEDPDDEEDPRATAIEARSRQA